LIDVPGKPATLDVIPGLAEGENPGSRTADVSGCDDLRPDFFGIVSVYGSRVPLRGPGMTRRISVRSVDSQQAFSTRYETPRRGA
jgi:hypothetical protein